MAPPTEPPEGAPPPNPGKLPPKTIKCVRKVFTKEVFSEKSCFKNFAHPLSEGENIKK